MTPLSRHAVYLEAQGVTPLMLRMPLAGALASIEWAQIDAQEVVEQSPVAIRSIVDEPHVTAPSVVALSSSDMPGEASSPVSTATVLHADVVQSVPAVAKPVAFHFSVVFAGNLFLIDEYHPSVDRRLHQKLLLNIAQSLSAHISQSHVIDLHWPLKDNPQLDKSKSAANAFIQSWVESLVAKHQTRFVILLGTLSKEWFAAALDQLHLPHVQVHTAREMLETPQIKAQCWRSIRSYQALVAMSPVPHLS